MGDQPNAEQSIGFLPTTIDALKTIPGVGKAEGEGRAQQM